MKSNTDKTSFTNQKHRIATEEDCKAKWSGGGPGENFRCYLCGYKFKPGDGWRWQYGNGRTFVVDNNKYGVVNFLVCDNCDSPTILDKWVDIHQELYTRFWWFRKD